MNETIRKKTDFVNDVKEFGPIGEIDLLNRLKESQITSKAESIAEDKRFVPFDIDIIQYKEGFDGDKETVLENLRNGKKANSFSDYVLYEVKTDTYGMKSRNIFYEVFDHGKPGCLDRSKADYLYYVYIDENKVISEIYLIKMETLRYWIMTEFANINKVPYFITKYMDRKKDKTCGYLINVDYLCKNSIEIDGNQCPLAIKLK